MTVDCDFDNDLAYSLVGSMRTPEFDFSLRGKSLHELITNLVAALTAGSQSIQYSGWMERTYRSVSFRGVGASSRSHRTMNKEGEEAIRTGFRGNTA